MSVVAIHRGVGAALARALHAAFYCFGPPIDLFLQGTRRDDLVPVPVVPRAVLPRHMYRPGGHSRGVPVCLEEQLEALQCFQDHGCQVVGKRVPRAVVRRRQCEDAWGAFDPKVTTGEGAQEGSFVETLVDGAPLFGVCYLRRFVLCPRACRLNKKGLRRCRDVGGGSAGRYDAPEP